MTLTAASDPAAWCHAELDTEGLPEDLAWAATDARGTAVDEVVLPHPGTVRPDESSLIEAIELLESDVQAGSRRVRVHDLRQSVLDVWDMADQVGADAAEPLETLLGRLTATRVSRSAVTAALQEARRRVHPEPRAWR